MEQRQTGERTAGVDYQAARDVYRAQRENARRIFRERHPTAELAYSPLNSSESVVSSASAIRLAVGIVGECQPRSISPKYFASMRGTR
jgi:hypothetical protein